ncbi:TolC family outer membrane protein [Benzoatithermus flavus]|uniref:TolC family outer membrane protein n=1 Tax=Benzoatithermus flavus TaxID=3108223 RepID=A0ABU8XL19_9PROT
MAKHPSVGLLGRVVLRTLLTSVALVAGSALAEAGSIRDTVQATLDTSPEIGALKANRRAVDQELRQARAKYYPSLDARAAIGPEYTRFSGDRRRAALGRTDDDDNLLLRKEVELTLSQMLFDGYETRSEVERQTARVDSAAHRVQEAAEFTALDAIEAHLEVLRHQDLIKLNEANLQQLERYLGQVRGLERGGRADTADVQQTEARIAEARANLAQARGALADAIANYQQIVGQKPAGLTAEPSPVRALPPGPEEAADAASVKSPTVLIAAADVDVAEAELRGTRANYLPRLDAELAATAADDANGVEGESVGAQAMLVMRYNLFRGGADIAREREAFHRQNQARIELERARRKAEQEARLSYNAYQTARARVVDLRAEAEAQRRTRDAYASQFELGLRPLLDVLDAENQLFTVRVAQTTAEYTERFAVYRVLAVTGALLDTLEIVRPREDISIYRTPADLQTPQAVRAKSRELLEPKAEPRPLRGYNAGEPPYDALDAAKAVR